MAQTHSISNRKQTTNQLAKPQDFYSLVQTLQNFWVRNGGCSVVFPYFTEVGAGTFHPVTVFNSISKNPSSFVYVQGCSRPTDGRYGENPNRLQYYYQLQVLINPALHNIKEIYLESLKSIGLDILKNDIRFVEDDWESPSLGAFGLGWEVWCNGMEITQFTYFQQVGGVTPPLAPVEITYGLERLAMYILGKDSVYDMPWQQVGFDCSGWVDSTPNINLSKKVQDKSLNYGFFSKENERQFSEYNFKYANIEMLTQQFATFETEAQALLEHGLIQPAYLQASKAAHCFNLLDARGSIGVNQRARYIQRIQVLVKQCCNAYIKQEELVAQSIDHK